MGTPPTGSVGTRRNARSSAAANVAIGARADARVRTARARRVATWLGSWTSDGALGALVRSLAVRLGRHDIQVNAVQPGWIETDATAPALRHQPLNDVILQRTPAGRWGKTEDLQGIAVYLASDASRFHTGDTIRIDGGYSVF